MRRGEVLGFAGLVGSGRTEVAEAIFGIWPAEEGTIRRSGEIVDIQSPRDAMDQDIAYVSEDRRRLGLSLPQSVTTNITLAGLRRFVSRWGWSIATRSATPRRSTETSLASGLRRSRRRSSTSLVGTNRR